jgi:L-2-hydroxyglutarate oxidase LhgO
MSYADIVPDTEAQQILAGIARIEERQERLTTAVNDLGAKVQWVIDNVSGIFQMFASPQMMAMLPNMMTGAMSAVQVPQNGDTDVHPAE